MNNLGSKVSVADYSIRQEVVVTDNSDGNVLFIVDYEEIDNYKIINPWEAPSEMLTHFVLEEYETEIEDLLADKVYSQEYKEETVYTITTGDVRRVIKEEYPQFTEEQVEHFVERARVKLDLDWEEQVYHFVSERIREVDNI